ncbi:MAG: hypothetical protein ACFCU6_05795, partial [Balneolaceae bacterium]
FYYQIATDTWKHIWVTQNATDPGGVKEKKLIREADNGSVIFRGEIPVTGGGTYLDQTTLIPLLDGSVRQRIEISTNSGKNWRKVFDGIYIRKNGRH